MYIETGRGKIPVRYGMNALAHFGDLTGKNMSEVLSALGDFGKLKMSEVLTFIYVGFVDGARKAGEDCKVSSIEDLADFVDDEGDIIEKALSVYSDQAPPPAKVSDKKK